MKKPLVTVITTTIVLLVCFLIFMGTAILVRGYADVKARISTVTGPVLKGLSTAAGSVAGVFGSYIVLIGTKKENEELKKEIAELRLLKTRMDELEKENKRYRGLLSFMQHQPAKMIAANIIGEDLKNWYKCVIIDKGSSQGLREKMTVLTPNGLVGQIVEADASHAKVMVINDTNSSVDVVVQGKNTRGILEGTGQNTLRLKYVRKNDDIENGDKLVTSGKDSIFSKGLPVGLVMKVERGNPGIFAEVSVMPYNDFKKLDEILVMKK